MIPEDQVNELEADLWYYAIKYNFKGDLKLLPERGLPTIHDGLDQVTSKRFYDQLCQYQPDLIGITQVQKFFQTPKYWRWTRFLGHEFDFEDDDSKDGYNYNKDNEFHDDPYEDWYLMRDRNFEKWKLELYEWDDLFVHVAMRQHWPDKLDSLMSMDQLKLFIVAGCRGHVELFKTLLPMVKESEDGPFKDICHYIFLMATEWGYVDIVSVLLEEGRIRIRKTCEKALKIAADNGDLDMVKKLVNVDDVDATDAIRTAGCREHFHVAKYLLDNAESYNPTVWSTIAVMAVLGNGRDAEHHLQMLKWQGANCGTEMNMEFRTACLEGRVKVVKMFLGRPGIDVASWHNAALRGACRNGHIEVVKLLLEQPEVSADANDNEAFREACATGNLELVELLLTTPEVDPTAKDNEALALAATNNHIDVVKVLLRIDDVVATCQRNRAFYLAAAKGHLEVFQQMIQMPGVNIAARCDEAIMTGARHGNANIVEYILDTGNGSEEARREALILATRGQHDDVVDLLLEVENVD
ncbi:hypothetical protein HDU76_005679, partial [Blyttiomyces sp. JEL0837]